MLNIDVENLIETDINGKDVQFFTLDKYTIDKLKSIGNNNIDTLLLYYSYLRCKIFDTYNIGMISKETTLSKNTVIKYNKIFSDNNIRI